MGDADLTVVNSGRFAKGKPGNPGFVKGRSGNPLGKPASAMRFGQLCRIHSREMLDLALGIARNLEHPRQFEAIKFVIERGQGRPPETLNLNATVRTDLTWTAIIAQAKKEIEAEKTFTVEPTEVREAETE